MSDNDDDQPREVLVLDFVRDRADDIAQLLAAVDNNSLPHGEVTHGPRTSLQHLPRHMRRRAMSHNLRRYPLTQRRFAQSSAAATKHSKKPPSRYWRRRAANLLQAYQRRQRSCVWLESHIWHAKRCHMQSLWGYRIADRSCQRAFRATYRHSVRHATVHDSSYVTCVQLKGDRSVLLNGLQQLCSTEVGLTFRYVAAFDGTMERTIVLYRANQYPFECLGACRYLWLPESQGQTSTLCVWLHASVRADVVDELCAVFGLKLKAKNTETSKAEDTNLLTLSSYQLRRMQQCDRYHNTDATIELTDMRHQFGRFRIRGSKSTAVLGRGCQVVDPTEPDSDFPSTINNPDRNWWSSLLTVEGHRQSVKAYNDFWTELTSTSVADSVIDQSITDECVIPLCVRDPRLTRPKRKTAPRIAASFGLCEFALVGFSCAITRVKNCVSVKSTSGPEPRSGPNLPLPGAPLVCPTTPPESPIWSQSVRTTLLTHKVTDHHIYTARSKSMTSEGQIIDKLDTIIPVLLVRRSSASALQTGWDMIVPGGWCMPFWLSLQYATARVCGLRDIQHSCLERSVPAFPWDWVDTPAGTKMISQMGKQLEDKWDKRPPNRRCRYVDQLRVKYPFKFDWSELINDWSNEKQSANEQPTSASYFVCRDRRLLQDTQNWLLCSRGSTVPRLHARALLPVRIEPMGHGCPKYLAMICLPECTDSIHQSAPVHREPDGRPDPESRESGNSKSNTIGNDRMLSSYVPLVDDEQQMDLDKLLPDTLGRKAIHRAAKRGQRRKQQRLNKKKKKNNEQADQCSVKSGNVIGPKNYASRKLIGCVTRGDYSFARGRPFAIGYCVAAGVEQLQTLGERNIVLFRNTGSDCYHAARISIITGYDTD